MKKFFAVLVVIFVFCSAVTVWAEEGEKEKILTGKLGFSFYNKYVGTTDGQVYFNKPVIQGSLLVSHEPSGIYAEIWKSYSPKDGLNSDAGDEIDFSIGIERELAGLAIDAGYSYYNLYNLKHSSGDFHALYLNIDLPEIYKVTPYVNLEVDIPTDKKILEGGFLYKAGLKYALKVFDHPIDLNLSFSGHDGAFGTEPELVSSGNLKISSTFAVLGVDVTPEVNFQKRLGKKVEDGGLTQNIVWYGVIISYPFDIL